MRQALLCYGTSVWLALPVIGTVSLDDAGCNLVLTRHSQHSLFLLGFLPYRKSRRQSAAVLLVEPLDIHAPDCDLEDWQEMHSLELDQHTDGPFELCDVRYRVLVHGFGMVVL